MVGHQQCWSVWCFNCFVNKHAGYNLATAPEPALDPHCLSPSRPHLSMDAIEATQSLDLSQWKRQTARLILGRTAYSRSISRNSPPSFGSQNLPRNLVSPGQWKAHLWSEMLPFLFASLCLFSGCTMILTPSPTLPCSLEWPCSTFVGNLGTELGAPQALRMVKARSCRRTVVGSGYGATFVPYIGNDSQVSAAMRRTHRDRHMLLHPVQDLRTNSSDQRPKIGRDPAKIGASLF